MAGYSPLAMASGATAYLDAALGYRRANSRRSLTADAQGTLQGYPGYLDQPAPGAVATIGGMAKAGDSLTFNASERVGYEPFFNVFSQGATGCPLPPGAGAAAPVTGLYERRSLNSNTIVSMTRRWSRSDSTQLSYSYQVQNFINDADSAAPGCYYYGDSSSHNVTAELPAAGWRTASGRARNTASWTASTPAPTACRCRPPRTGSRPGPTWTRRSRAAAASGSRLTAGAAYVDSI